METQVYANRIAPKESPLYSQVRSIKKIVYDSPLIQRIIFDKGEIVLNVSGDQLNIFTRQYLPNGNSQITHQISKYVRENNAEQMLNRAKRDIVQRITDLEMKYRDKIIESQMGEYLNKHWEENATKLREKIGTSNPKELESLKKLADSFRISQDFLFSASVAS